ncbi:hypothetical protein PAMP_023363 [Pampus punctatissimus]
MSSPQTKGPDIPPGSLVVSETDSAAKSHKPDMRKRRKTRQSPFKVPESESIFLPSVNEKEDRKEEMRKFLALPIDEKMTHNVRMKTKLRKDLEEEEEEEEEEKMKTLKQTKRKTSLLKQTPMRHELKMAMMKRENIMKDSKHDLISMERQKAVLELSLMTKRSEILKMNTAMAKEERRLKQLEKIIERDNLHFEEFLKENEKKSVEARTFFEREAKSKQEKNAEIKKLTTEIGTWQEAQKVKTRKANVLSDGDAPDEQNTEPEESASRQGKYQDLGLESKASSPGGELPSIRESWVSSTQSSSEKDEDLLTVQINDMNQRIDKEKARAAKLQQRVQLHVSLNAEDQDDMLDALGEKVAEVHRCCMDDRMTNLSTLEKLASIENYISLLLQNLESIPEESLEMMKKIKDSERRSRQREEKQREQREKQKERMKRYLERSLADSKKISGRKLMPRCVPVAQKVRVNNVDSVPAEDEIHAYLFTSEDMD